MKRLSDWFILPWMRNKTPDKDHFYRRGFTRRYQVRKNRIKDLWIGGGLIALSYPVPAFLAILGLFCCFLTFAFLDENSL
ncbi:hypothetical protein [Oceanospirillum beijerinckii]|uniref:hypothetical protein n=1 Tax=Oceanospirillum beijerinckii TaxID=64976 RepID=UPI000421B9FA|nr:hypothetical protein [Oceanospirillum beijerinckii]